MLETLLGWIDSGRKPSPAAVAASCERKSRVYEGGCHYDLAFRPQPLDSRQYRR